MNTQSNEIDAEVQRIFVKAANFPEPFSALSAEQKQDIEAMRNRFDELRSQYNDLANAKVLYPLLLSKSGRYAEALEFSKHNYIEQPNWNSAIALANAFRRGDRIDEAVEMFLNAAEYDPHDVASWLEVGDIYLEREKYQEALDAYQKALEIDDQHQWALPSAFFCRHHLNHEGNWLASLKELANQEGCTCGMAGCLTEMFGTLLSSGDGIVRSQYLLSKVAA